MDGTKHKRAVSAPKTKSTTRQNKGTESNTKGNTSFTNYIIKKAHTIYFPMYLILRDVIPFHCFLAKKKISYNLFCSHILFIWMPNMKYWKNKRSIIHRGYYICVHDRRCLRHECLDYHNLGTSVVNIVCHGHEFNILFITVELLN